MLDRVFWHMIGLEKQQTIRPTNYYRPEVTTLNEDTKIKIHHLSPKPRILYGLTQPWICRQIHIKAEDTSRPSLLIAQFEVHG